MGIGITGVGKYIPTKEITNEQVEAWTGISAADIVSKIGVTKRYVVEDHETASGMSVEAARQAMAMAGITADQIGLIICATFTGDYLCPAMACRVQEQLGAKNAGAYDVMANCTGFQIGLANAADRMTLDASISYALVIGTALQSRFINWKDPNSAIYFSDGAGAAILARVPEGYGVLATDIMANGKVYDAVRVRGGGSSYPLRAENVNDVLPYFELNGLEVWKQVVQFQPRVIMRVLEKISKKTDAVDFFIFHQANLRLIEFLMAKMKHPMHKTQTNVETIGNTGEASMAIALCDAVLAGKLQRDQLVVISGVGAGFIFGATVLRWY